MRRSDLEWVASLDDLAVLIPVVYLPVLLCDTCEQDRPHLHIANYCACVACGEQTHHDDDN